MATGGGNEDIPLYSAAPPQMDRPGGRNVGSRSRRFPRSNWRGSSSRHHSHDSWHEPPHRQDNIASAHSVLSSTVTPPQVDRSGGHNTRSRSRGRFPRSNGRGSSSRHHLHDSWHIAPDSSHDSSDNLASAHSVFGSTVTPSQVDRSGGVGLRSRGRFPRQFPRSSGHGDKSVDRDKSWFESLRDIPLQDINSLSKLPPESLVDELFKRIKSFQGTLQKPNTLQKPGIMQSVIEMLSKIAETLHSSGSCHKASQILGEVLSERCTVFQFHLKMYVNTELCRDTANTSRFGSRTPPIEKIRLACGLFRNLLVSLPSSSFSCLPVDELNRVVQDHMSNAVHTTSDRGSINDLVGNVVFLRDKAREENSRQVKEKKPVEANWDNSEYKDIQILPQWNEVCVPQKPPRLRKRIVSGSYTDWLHYYDIQFRLLREDFIAPLRNGVCDYLNGARGRKLKNVRIYKNVLILEPIFHDSGICYKIKLDFSSMRRRCNWEHSKRLLYGSLLCLSPDSDNFNDEVYFATVTDRDPAKIVEGNLEVMFQGDEDMLVFSSSATSFTVVESCAYFEASRHILRSLQTAEVDTMPFEKYLISGNCKSVDPPEYLRESTRYNLSFLLTKEEKHKLLPFTLQCKLDSSGDSDSSTLSDDESDQEESVSSVNECFVIPNVANLKNWPTCDQTELDNSQLAGLHMALTQEIAVIQGPPGTGKTYIGLKIVEALLSNKDVWNSDGTKSPILVMCFTNHALDQFLEGIMECPLYQGTAPENLKLVRIGGRCRSEKLSKFNLRNMKRDTFLPRAVLHKKFQAQEKVKEFESSISLYGAVKSDNRLLALDELEACILPEYYSALFRPLTTGAQCSCALQIWLGLVETDNPWFNAWTDQPIVSDTPAELKTATKEAPEIAVMEESEHSKTDGQQGEIISELDDKSLIDVMGEATVEQAGRILDDAGHHAIKEVKFMEHSSDYSQFMKYLSGLVSRTAAEHAHEVFYEDGKTSLEIDTSIWFNASKAEHNIRSVFSVDAMSKSEYQHISDILALSIKNRHRLYRYWHKQYLKHLCKECEREFCEYNRLCKEQDQARKEADRFTLETAEIIGMTTTGAAKYQHILHLVKPRIVIVEEAAEVLESHIVSALNAGTQHLILIGDHKQLRPKPNEYELAKKYNLDVSLFERLIRNGFPHASLEFQHRMSPEIAQLVKPHIYTTLSNHSSVEQYPDIRGVSTNLFFISHQFQEKEDENLVSHSNTHEATYLVRLCNYLLQQRYEPHQITILVTYSGQLLAIRKLMPKAVFDGVRVSTVDNFQGEENDIILLSLVRSNNENNVGFLREENRVCVALSRARMGFYCIGNFTMLRDQVPLWNDIMSDMEEKGKLSDGLLLHCSNHQDTNFTAKNPRDFLEMSPEGGCLKDCTVRLVCGHVCSLKCHYTDPSHVEFVCKKRCTKKCKEGHPCRNLCHQPCMCTVRVTRSMPGCNHDKEMECHEDPESLQCVSPCKELCPKGHSCPLKCYEKCKPCVVKVSVTMPRCQHLQWIACSEKIFEVSCKADCSRKCENGHPCPKLCHEDCGLCTNPVTKTISECKHKIDLPCHVKPNHESCTESCERVLPCSHKCQLRCGESCSSVNCEVKVTVELPGCGHQIPVPCHTSKDMAAIACPEQCTKNLPCGHGCGLKCSEPCKTKCMVKVNKAWPCGHKLKRSCFQIATPWDYPCNSKCEKVLDCGHACPKLCGEQCSIKCQEQVSKCYPCGHTAVVACSSTPSQLPCKKLCSHILACGHKCSGKCSECTTKRIHLPCKFKMGIKRFCGHSIQVPCGGLTDSHPGKKEVTISCCHKKVNQDCSSVDFHTCDEPCDWSCAHHECRKQCSEECDRPVCDERCTEKLKCGHQCHGLCGEPCLSLCPQCQLKKFNKKLKSPDLFISECAYYELPCSHVFSVEYLDSFVQAEISPKADVLVTPLQCPVKECLHLFSCSYRYGNHMKRLLSCVQEVNDVLRSAPSASALSGLTLQRRIKEIANSDNMEVIGEEEYKSLSRDQQKGWGCITSNSSHVQYKPMREVTATICSLLGTRKLRQIEDRYFAFMFIGALNYLQILSDEENSLSLTDTPDYEVTLKEVKRFLRFLSSKLKGDHQVKLTYQLIIDTQNELLRLLLCVHIALAKSGAKATTADLMEVESYLVGISTMTSKIIRTDFRRHMDVISRLIPPKTTLNYQKVLEEIDEFHPAIYRGNWWQCSKGHYYCSPPTVLDDVIFNCLHCKLGSYEDFVQLPDQEKIRSVAHLHEQVADKAVGPPGAVSSNSSGFDEHVAPRKAGRNKHGQKK